ncbi:MAG: hypothetical protein ACOCW3_03265 [Spirochaetota bacterium]
MQTLPRAARCALLFAALVALSGCLSTETNVALDADGSGSLDLSYVVDRPAWDTGVFDDSDGARPVPVTRGEFERAAGLIEGLELRSHRISRTDEQVTVEARLRFDSPAALASLLGADALEIEVGENGGSWRYVVAPGGGADGEQAHLLADELAAYTLSFSLRTPAPVVATTGDTDAERTASFSATLDEVATAMQPIVWEVRW